MGNEKNRAYNNICTERRKYEIKSKMTRMKKVFSIYFAEAFLRIFITIRADDE